MPFSPILFVPYRLFAFSGKPETPEFQAQERRRSSAPSEKLPFSA